MPGSLNDILPNPISEENERILLAHLKQELKTAVSQTVGLLHAMEERFGPEARQVVKEMAGNRQPKARPDAGKPESDLHKFCDRLDRACAGSHRWQRVIDEPDRIAYHFSRCIWAEIYRELGEPDLGFIICAGDEPAVKSCNPKLGFSRTKVLMNGDELCDHVFHVEK